ncbi:MAG: glycosyltransferase family 2 protein [Actinobacteria bacterium]|nr:glycosyltransferase family 2 protein [Actinomycetota bacterium]
MPDVVLPIRNEEKAIQWVLERMPAEFRPIVVDNGSTDRSASIARSMGALVVFEGRPGFGAACFAGLCAATSEIVCFMDCDGSLDPRHLARVSEPVRDNASDLVVGRRLPARGSWPLHARAANRLLAAVIRRQTGTHLRDLGPMRAARREALLALDLKDRRFGWPLEMVLRASSAGWTITEVPVPYDVRSGRSKVTGTLVGTLRTAHDMARLL